MDIEEHLLEEDEALGLHLLALVEHLLHVLYVLGVVAVDLLQGSLVLLLGSLHLFFRFLHALLQLSDLQ